MADVEFHIESSSNTIGKETNWMELAKYLDIYPGVNDQGVGLLKQTFEMFDSNVSGEFAAEGFSIDRWLDGVKKAKQ